MVHFQKSPVLARAVLLNECANFVYRCNRGMNVPLLSRPHNIIQI